MGSIIKRVVPVFDSQPRTLHWKVTPVRLMVVSTKGSAVRRQKAWSQQLPSPLTLDNYNFWERCEVRLMVPILSLDNFPPCAPQHRIQS